VGGQKPGFLPKSRCSSRGHPCQGDKFNYQKSLFHVGAQCLRPQLRTLDQDSRAATRGLGPQPGLKGRNQGPWAATRTQGPQPGALGRNQDSRAATRGLGAQPGALGRKQGSWGASIAPLQVHLDRGGWQRFT
jgi:hypothetical protein